MKKGNIMAKKKNKKRTIKKRNWIAVAAHFRVGAGAHKNKRKYIRKIKHKSKDQD